MGDYFYLCYGSRIQLLGQITSNDAVENPEMKDGWYERPYRVVAMPKINDSYDGVKKWWTPNDNSTCIKVDDKPLFEELILKPYFGGSCFFMLPHSALIWRKTQPPAISP